MFTKNISFKSFNLKKKNKNTIKILHNLLKEDNQIIKSLTKNYKYSFDSRNLKKFKKYSYFRIIGMGGSILGAHAIYDFLANKIKKNFSFINNITFNNSKIESKFVNIIISKSGNTLETILNSNKYLKNKNKNIFITENKNNYLNNLAKKIKSEIVHHNNFIGGRYSVMSEVGMLPAELMGLKPNNFKQFNNLIKNKAFFRLLISNVNSLLYLIKNKKTNSIIINYDEKSNNLFTWYQQLVAESLGKKGTGLFPIISNMPKDNHSVMQFYLDGLKNNFFTFFYTHEKESFKLKRNKNFILDKYLDKKSLNEITFAQKKATENIFRRRNIPFRSFEIFERNEKTLGELFTFFILETILLGKVLKVNPYNQPSVDLIKMETKKILI